MIFGKQLKADKATNMIMLGAFHQEVWAGFFETMNHVLKRYLRKPQSSYLKAK